MVSLGCMPCNEIAGSCRVLFPVFFKGISTLISIVAVSVFIHTNSVRGFLFLHTFIYCYTLFNDCHSDLNEMKPHCGFDMHFYNNEWHWESFHGFYSSVCLLWGKVYLVLLATFWLGCSFFGIELHEMLVYFRD